MQSKWFKHRVADYLDGEPIHASRDTPLVALERLLVSTHVLAIPVVDNRIVVGIVSRLDLMRIAIQEDEVRTLDVPWPKRDDALREMTAEDAMDRAPCCIASDAKLFEAARMMCERRTDRLIVVDNGRLRGVITSHQVLYVVRPRRYCRTGPAVQRA